MTLSLFIPRPSKIIKDMVNWKKLSDKISGEVRLQHFTTSTKLAIARQHCHKLKTIVPTQKVTDLVKVKFVEPNKVSIEFRYYLPAKIDDYFDKLDAFFYSLRSCIDSFFWEINLIFNLGFSRINFKEIREKMNEKYIEKEITNLLYDLRDEPWFKYLNGIRNCLAHHKLSEFATAKDLKLYLPSNPEELDKPGSYSLEKEFEVLPCLETLSINVRVLRKRIWPSY